MTTQDTCPCCGTPVTIEGNTTKYYVPKPVVWPSASELDAFANQFIKDNKREPDEADTVAWLKSKVGG